MAFKFVAVFALLGVLALGTNVAAGELVHQEASIVGSVVVRVTDSVIERVCERFKFKREGVNL